MLVFREINYDRDIDEIVLLLNKNFDSNHTKESFLWKHFKNPFGKSYGLIATEHNKIVALRMFMRWEFLCSKKIVKAIRPVDTCTDHEYRGKGLFKKITLQGLKNINEEYQIVFNTPNQNSKPGYLKMGWKEIQGPFKYKLGIINFFIKPRAYVNKAVNDLEIKDDWLKKNGCQTNISTEFILWRYSDPIYKIAEFTDGFIIYKLIRLKGIKTMVLIDLFGVEDSFSRNVTSICNKNNARTLYYLDNTKNKSLKFLMNFSRGEQTVVSKHDMKGIGNQLKFSVGDLESKL